MAVSSDLRVPWLSPLHSSPDVLLRRHGFNLSCPASLTQLASSARPLRPAPSCRYQPPPRPGASEAPPTTREEALSQARNSISVFLEKALRDAGPSSVKQRLLRRQARLRVELPLLNESDSERASLLSDLLHTLRVGKRSAPVSFSVFSGPGVKEHLVKSRLNADLVEGTDPDGMKHSNVTFHEIADSVAHDGAQVILILAPKLSDVLYITNIAKAGEPRPVILLNPDWSAEEEGADSSNISFLQSFEVVYSYLPLAIQGFFSKTEGAVLKHVKSGAPSGVRWFVFAREGESMNCVASFKNRPTAADLENALYNAMAANSPITKSIKFFRGIIGGKD